MQLKTAVLQFLLTVIGYLAVSCSAASTDNNQAIKTPEPTGLSGKVLAETHCGSCHVFPEPNLLPKQVWTKSVLPEMGFRLGIGGYLKKMTMYSPEEMVAVINTAVYPQQPLIAEEDWQKIVAYYAENAPEKLARTPDRTTQSLGKFTIKQQNVADNGIMATEYDSNKNVIFIGSSSKTNRLLSFSNEAILSDAGTSESPVVSRKFHPKYGEVRLEIGIMDPSDLAKGKLKAGNKILVDHLHRPVDFILADINEDGIQDFVVANFGSLSGNLSWYDGETFAPHLLLNDAGARVIYYLDFDKDGRKDLVVLMTQGNEGIVLLKNTGKGKFKIKRLLDFPPVYGSSYVDVVDFDKDGDYDLVYTSGDNADYSEVGKPYHGVRIFINNGGNKFTENYFYAINGASKVVVADFDNDGDNDMGIISYYPDRSRNEGFMYFEQTSPLNFVVRTKEGISNEKWLTLDYGDFNKDGKLDFVLGSYQKDSERPPKIGSLVVLLNEGK